VEVCVRGFFFVIFMLAGCFNADVSIDPKDQSETIFEVPKGSTANGIGTKLVNQGFVGAQWQWKLFMRQEATNCVKAGRFSLRRSMTMRQIYKTLCGVPLAEDIPFTVVEGWRIRDIDQALTEDRLSSSGDYADLARTKKVTLPFEITSKTLEGYLFPETYRVNPKPFSPKNLIERQLQTFKSRFLDKHQRALEGRGLHGIVTMAAMIEREEPNERLRPVVAGILWKRHDAGWQLGVDATSRYHLVNWNDRRTFLKYLRDPADPYNTRIHKGLPPGPIGNPSVSSLEAAIFPKESPYWFYLHDANGELHGALNGDGHDRNRRKYNVY
jgi:UPF0755 protein